MVQSRITLLVPAVLLLCSGLGEAADRSTVLDRFTGNFGHYVLNVDKTSFTVDHPVTLTAFELPKVYGYHPKSKTNIEDVPADVRVFEISQSGKKNEIFVGQTYLNSYAEPKVEMPSKVELKPGFEYLIEVETPIAVSLMTNEMYKNSMVIRRFFEESVHIKFQQRNPTEKPSFDRNSKRNPSNGLVRRFHLKF